MLNVNLGLSSPASSSVVEHRHGNVTVTLQPTSAALSSVHHDTDDDDDDDDHDHDYDDHDHDHDGSSDTSKSFNKVNNNNRSFVGHGAAIIALSLGVSLTAVLIVFASCHFCRRHRGSWKGRRYHVGETDYLVDGMYL